LQDSKLLGPYKTHNGAKH